ncbi:MAG: hypothetical protein ACRCXZ_01500 [Patescibacteria group bacterium]
MHKKNQNKKYFMRKKEDNLFPKQDSQRVKDQKAEVQTLAQKAQIEKNGKVFGVIVSTLPALAGLGMLATPPTRIALENQAQERIEVLTVQQEDKQNQMSELEQKFANVTNQDNGKSPKDFMSKKEQERFNSLEEELDSINKKIIDNRKSISKDTRTRDSNEAILVLVGLVTSLSGGIMGVTTREKAKYADSEIKRIRDILVKKRKAIVEELNVLMDKSHSELVRGLLREDLYQIGLIYDQAIQKL